MLSRTALELARLLRAEIGADKVGLSVTPRRLVTLWAGQAPQSLRDALDELICFGFVGTNTAIAEGRGETPPEYGLRGVVSVTVLDALQEYFDKVDA